MKYVASSVHLRALTQTKWLPARDFCTLHFTSFRPRHPSSIYSFIFFFLACHKLSLFGIRYALQDVQYQTAVNGEVESIMSDEIERGRKRWANFKELIALPLERNGIYSPNIAPLHHQIIIRNTKWYNTGFWCVLISKWYFASILNGNCQKKGEKQKKLETHGTIINMLKSSSISH